MVVIDALIGVATPVLAGRVVNEITRHGEVRVVVKIAIVIAALAVVDAVLSFAQRWYSARIGEGLIFDMRTAVFDHVQRMPLAFFTRTQTGALVSRLNNDVLGAQQAFTSTLSGLVSNVVSLVLTAAVMFSLSWQITALALVMLPVFVIPARRIGTRLQAITRESYTLNASMNATMTERFNVAGALLVKLFGRPQDEDRSFRDRAARVRDIGITSAMYSRAFFVALTLVAALAQALVYGLGGYYALTGVLDTGTVVTLALLLSRLYGPLTALSNARVDIMSALVSFDRVFEVLDLPPMIDDAPDAIELPADASSIEFDDVRFSYPTASEVSLASLEDVAVLDTAPAQEVLRGVSFRAEPGELIALVGPSGAGKTTISQLVPRIYDVRSGRVLDRRSRRAFGHPAVAARSHRRRQPGRPHVPRHDPREPRLRQARRRPMPSCGRRSRPRRSPTSSPRCPTASTRWWAIGAIGCPAVRSSVWPSPGCCSRRRRSSSWTRRPPISTARTRWPCRRHWRRPSPAVPRWSSPTASRRCWAPTRSSSSTGGASSRAAPMPSCCGRRPVRRAVPHAVREAGGRRGVRGGGRLSAPDQADLADLADLADRA